MAQDYAASYFKRKFIARTAYAREKAGYTQERMAEELGIGQPKYHKYEGRSLLPHYLVPQFCLLTGVTPQWLYTAAIDVAQASHVKRRRKRRKKVA